FTANDQIIDAILLKMRDQGRAEERRGPLFVDDEFARYRGKLGFEGVGVVGLAADVAVGRMHPAGVNMASRIDDRYAGPARGPKQTLGRRKRPPRMFAAGAGEFPIDLLHRTIAAAIRLIVEIDGEHRGIVAHIELAAIGLIDLDRVGVDEVLPAMVFEVARHDVLLFERGIAGREGSPIMPRHSPFALIITPSARSWRNHNRRNGRIRRFARGASGHSSGRTRSSGMRAAAPRRLRPARGDTDRAWYR